MAKVILESGDYFRFNREVEPLLPMSPSVMVYGVAMDSKRAILIELLGDSYCPNVTDAVPADYELLLNTSSVPRKIRFALELARYCLICMNK